MIKLVFLALLALTPPALAVKTQHWTHTSSEDFKKGNPTKVLVTPSGGLELARSIQPLLPADRRIDAITAVVEMTDGAIALATFPDGDVLSFKDGKLTTLTTFKDRAVTALSSDGKGGLLVGLGGETANVARIDAAGGEPTIVAELADAAYVWSIFRDGDTTYVGTGPNGKVFKIDNRGKLATFAELAVDHVICLTADKTHVYAGTAGDARVYKIDKRTAKPYVVYEAAEGEIGKLVWDDHGNLLAATSDSGTASELPTPTEPAATSRPAAGIDLPARRPVPPSPPEPTPDDAIPQSAPPRLGPTTLPAGPSPTSLPDFEPPGTATAASNAVYKIDPAGLVTELFRKAVIVHDIAWQDGKLLLATGDNGEVYRVDAATGENRVVLRTAAPDATNLLVAQDGTLHVATSNAGQLYKVSAGHAVRGTYDSEPLDATVPSTFGQLHLLGTLPDGTRLTVQTRAGNTRDPDTGDWADWTAPRPVTAFVPVESRPARFLQYRLTFATDDATKTPTVDEVDAAYQKPNLPPTVSGITVTPADDGQMTVAWEAADANDDALRYTLAVRLAGDGPWMTIAQDLTEATHPWNAKNLPDGTYEVRVTADDTRANPPDAGKTASRTSGGMLIDNTPPTIGDVKTFTRDGVTRVTFRVVDRAGSVADVETTVGRIDRWQKRLPDDTIADSPEERYTVPLSDLGKGPHALLVKATDARGNASFETIAVTVP